MLPKISILSVNFNDIKSISCLQPPAKYNFSEVSFNNILKSKSIPFFGTNLDAEKKYSFLFKFKGLFNNWSLTPFNIGFNFSGSTLGKRLLNHLK